MIDHFSFWPRMIEPGGYIPRLESKERECWKFLDWQLNSENYSRLHGQPSIFYGQEFTGE
jgi:hypothetical protein